MIRRTNELLTHYIVRSTLKANNPQGGQRRAADRLTEVNVSICNGKQKCLSCLVYGGELDRSIFDGDLRKGTPPLYAGMHIKLNH